MAQDRQSIRSAVRSPTLEVESILLDVRKEQQPITPRYLPTTVKEQFTPSIINEGVQTQYIKSQDPPKLMPERTPPLTISDHAPFWSTYNRVAGAFDGELIDGWNKSLDVLLIFAGLFSAIDTAFIIESYRGLQPDPAETTNNLLRILITHVGGNATLFHEELHPKQSTSSAVPINSIFFSSLSFSLTAAFGAVAAKQWLIEYTNTGIMDSLEVQGRRRQEKYSGLKTWRLKLVIELLPMFLQLSLLLFLIGVVKLLREWDQEVAAIQLILSCAGLAVYCVTIIIGIIDPSSPFQTPLSRFVQRYSSKMNLTLGLSVFQDFSTHASMERLLNLPYQTLHWVQDSFGVVVPGVESPILPTNALVPQGGNPKKGRSKWDSGLVADAEAVIWLLERAEHPDVAITALDAVRHLPPSLVHRLIQEREGLLKKLIAFHHNLLPLALSTENQAKWLDAWPDAAVVSALAWNHILWAESLDHKDRLAIRSSLSESDPYCHANVSEVLENNQDRYLSAKCLLMFSLGGYHGLNVEDLLKRCIKHDTVSLSASPHIRIKFPDASRAFNRDIVTSFSPLQLMLDSVMNLLSVPDIRWTSSSQDYLLEHLDSLLQGELSHDTVSYAAIAFAAIRSGTSNYPDSNPNVSFGIPSRPRQRRLVGYQERDSQEVMNEVRTQINRWMATRTNAPDRGLILLEHVSLAVSVVRGGKDEDIGILKTLLDMTSNLFEEKYRYPEQPIPYQYFPRDLVQLARLAPNDEHMQVLVAKLLCQCPDGDWTTLLREDLGQDIQTIFKFALENDHNDFLVGHLVERVKDDIQFLDPPTRLIALRNYCIKKVRNHKLTASIDASTWFSQFMPKNNGEYLDGTNLLQTQVSCATMILIIGQAESGVSNDTLFMYFETLLARDPDLIRPEDVGIPGLMGGWGQQLSHVWRGEALLLLWRMAKKARYLDGSPSKWESSLFFSSQVGDLMLEYSVEVLKRRYNSMDYGKLLRDYLETKLQVWRTSNREGLERRRQIEDIVQKLGQFFD